MAPDCASTTRYLWLLFRKPTFFAYLVIIQYGFPASSISKLKSAKPIVALPLK
jgi:hypothetical protein